MALLSRHCTVVFTAFAVSILLLRALLPQLSMFSNRDSSITFHFLPSSTFVFSNFCMRFLTAVLLPLFIFIDGHTPSMRLSTTLQFLCCFVLLFILFDQLLEVSSSMHPSFQRSVPSSPHPFFSFCSYCYIFTLAVTCHYFGVFNWFFIFDPIEPTSH